LTAWAGETTLVLALAVSMGIVAWGWAGALGLPTPRGTVAVLVVAGLSILISVYVPEQGNQMSLLPGALAVSIMAAFLHQLLRRDGRPRVAESVSSVVLALVVFTCSAFFLPLSSTTPGSVLLLAALSAIAVSVLVTFFWGRLPEPLGPWGVPTMLLAGGAAGGALGGMSAVSWTTLALVGVLAAGLSHAIRHVFTPLPMMQHLRPQTVIALASVLMVGIVPYAAALAFFPAAL
ncbi:MAG: hypothetical protein WBG57_11430, partial [Ornithinimicrobium sp.]